MKHHQLKSNFFPFFHEKMLNLAERRKKRCVKIEKKIRAAGSFCMDQSYLRFLIRLARKSKQSGLSKSEKTLAKRNATLIVNMRRNCRVRRAKQTTHDFSPINEITFQKKATVNPKNCWSLVVIMNPRRSQTIKIGIDKNRQQSSDFYRLITEIGENLCQIDIIDFSGF